MFLKPYLALMADDSEDEQMLVHCFLRFVPNVRLIGYVQDGLEAVSYLQGTGPFGDRMKFPYPDLLLLDYQMPRLNGMEVLALLPTERTRPRVVFWSNTLQLVDQELARDLGADIVCEKPMSGLGMAIIMNQLGWPQSRRRQPAPAEYYRPTSEHFPAYSCGTIAGTT